MISKTKIGKRLKLKKKSEVVETLLEAKKQRNWIGIAKMVSSSRRKYSSINLRKIEDETMQGETVVVVGKVLGVGEISKKIRVCAFGFSESAREKLKAQNSECVSILDEIKKNPKAEGVKIIR